MGGVDGAGTTEVASAPQSTRTRPHEIDPMDLELDFGWG